MEEKLNAIKNWLGTGSINIFGLPMSGKDTVGIRLAEDLGAKFISSGLIIRAKEQEIGKSYSGDGSIIPTNFFLEWVLPYLEKKELWQYPLILSSVGRWYGEETQVMSVAAGAGHEIKAVILLNISEADVMSRWEVAKTLNDRGDRLDDNSAEKFKKRLAEFREKTLPVLQRYREMEMLIEVRADMDRDEVYKEMINRLYEFSRTN